MKLTLIYNKNTNEVLDTTSVFTLPDYLLEGLQTNSLPTIALVEYALKDGDISKAEQKQLGLTGDGAALLELSHKLNQNGIPLGEAMFLYQQEYANFDLMGAYAGIKSLKVRGSVSAPLKVINESPRKVPTKTAGNAANGNKVLWGSWSDYEKVTVNGQEYAKVGDRLYSRHAVDRMQPSGMRYTSDAAGGKVGASRIESVEQVDYGRGVAPQYVEDVIGSTKPVGSVNRFV